MIRLCIANEEHYGDGFMTLIRAAFWRLTKIRHGTLRRTIDNLVKKWRKTFENQGSETGEELDTPEGLAIKEWIDIVDRNKTKSKRAPKAAADQAQEAKAAHMARQRMMLSQKRKKQHPDPSQESSDYKDSEEDVSKFDNPGPEDAVRNLTALIRRSISRQSSSIALSDHSASRSQSAKAKRKRTVQLEEEQVTQKELTSALVRLADKMGSNNDAKKVKINKMANDMKDIKDKIGTLTNLLLQQQQHR